MCEETRQFNEYGDAACVVVRAGMNFPFVLISHIGPSQAEVVIVRADDHALSGELRLLPGNHADHILQSRNRLSFKSPLAPLC